MRRVGLHIGKGEITAVIVERGRVVWSAATPSDAESPSTAIACIVSSLGSLLDRLPREVWPTLRVTTALGPPWSRVKLVRGVPAVNRRELLSMIRLNTSRFVASSQPVIVTGAIMVTDGEVCIGIADLGLVEAVTRSIVDHKLRVGRIIPAVAIRIAEDTSGNAAGSRNDGSGSVGYATGVAIAARAAGAGRSLELGLRSRDNPAAVIPDASRRRVTVAAGFLAAATVIYFGSQMNIERNKVMRDRSAVRNIVMVSDSVAREAADLSRLNRDLTTTTSFSRRRTSTALLLGAITQALPAEAAITTLRIDTTTVDIVTLAPRTAAVVDALAEVPSLATPTIIGPVSRETVGARELERATIRLHIMPDFNRAKARFGIERDQDR